MLRNQQKESECGERRRGVMTPIHVEPKQRGFSRLELFLVIAVLTMLSGMLLLAQTGDKAGAQTVACANNLKQIYLSFKTFSIDNDDRFPMGVPTKGGGSMEFTTGGNAFRHFQVVSNELYDRKVRICPSDNRKSAEGFGRLTNTNLSYFVGVDAVSARKGRSHMWLSGDRNLTINAIPARTGLVSVQSTDSVGWSDQMHNGRGNLVELDGVLLPSVTEPRLRIFLRLTGTNVNRLAFP